jgi:hypothetical protein
MMTHEEEKTIAWGCLAALVASIVAALVSGSVAPLIMGALAVWVYFQVCWALGR